MTLLDPTSTDSVRELILLGLLIGPLILAGIAGLVLAIWTAVSR